jgi:putative membrane protein
MTSLNRKNLFAKLLTVAGIAGVSSLLAAPGFAELNRQTNDSNNSNSAGLIAIDPTNNTNPGGRPYDSTDPNNNNQPGGSPSESTNSPSNNNNSDRSSEAPVSDPNNNTNPGGRPFDSTVPTDNNEPGRPSNTPNTPSNNNNPGRSPSSSTGKDSSDSLSSRDSNFVMQAAQTGMLEVQLGRLAVQRGSSTGVKQYGQQMVDEHTRVNQELMQLAMQKGVELPKQMSDQNKALSDRLSGLSGASFDAAYKQAMIDSHNQAIALFQAQSQQGQDPQLKAWATQKLPNLQAHLQMVNQMLADVSQPQ